MNALMKTVLDSVDNFIADYQQDHSRNPTAPHLCKKIKLDAYIANFVANWP